ncbi:glycosyl hydrolase family 18 protein [Curtobacterium sp. MCPF17_002]|uniref:glycosyl hydrolase family 18 protein n=1 Tax=Curtobacterium sp. MCPF17_002 TaxID=2175645 RepID=UPI0021AD3785|nr:glycosyl hydrolase family 18 protein [Curtobacterium sp. MCPF17_002]WIB79297.1 glycosyl hydrolase family 18 protein [Curtobacterium sp. MCPF17_002]
MRRTGLVVAGALVLAAVLGGCATDDGTGGPAVEAYVEPGDESAARVSDAAGRSATIGIDGVTVAEDGAGLNDLPSGVGALARTARTGGAAPELLVSNYSESLGDFSPEIGTALLSDPDHRDEVAARLAELASEQHMAGVQIDLESLRSRDRAGLVAFAAALRTAVHDALGDDAETSIAVMASTSADGYRDTGYDLGALADHVDRFVLMTYDQHGPWSGPGTVGALPWAARVVRAAEAEGLPADRIDLGIAGYGYVWGGSGDAQVSPAQARKAAGDRARWSARNGEWSASLDDGRELHWSDARSYRARVDLAEDLGLHGVALWSLGTLALPS